MTARRMVQKKQISTGLVMDRREQILDAAQEIIQRVGYSKFGYRELSEAVGIRKASLHYHFPKKEELVLALVKRYTENFVQSLAVISGDISTSIAQLNAYFALFETALAESQNEKCCLAGVMGAEIGALPAFVRVEILRFCKKNKTWLSGLIERGTGEGVFSSAIEPKMGAQMIFSALEGAMMLSRLHGSSRYLADVVSQIRQLTLLDHSAQSPKCRAKRLATRC